MTIQQQTDIEHDHILIDLTSAVLAVKKTDRECLSDWDWYYIEIERDKLSALIDKRNGK